MGPAGHDLSVVQVKKRRDERPTPGLVVPPHAPGRGRCEYSREMNNTNEPSPTPEQSRTPRNQRVEQLAQWNVVLIHDQDHSYNYITAMLRDLFKLPTAKAVQIAADVNRYGRAVCCTSHLEHAEFKREQIHAYGRDPLVERCGGSMRAVVEPCRA